MSANRSTKTADEAAKKAEEYEAEDSVSSEESTASDDENIAGEASDVTSFDKAFFEALISKKPAELTKKEQAKLAQFNQHLAKTKTLAQYEAYLHHIDFALNPHHEKPDSAYNYLGNPDKAYDLIVNSGAVEADNIALTPFRVGIALDYAIHNGANDDTPSPNSDIDSATSPVADAFYATAALSFAVGVTRKVIQIRRQRQLNSMAYVLKQLHKIDPDNYADPKSMSDAERAEALAKLSKDLREFLERGKIDDHKKAIDDYIAAQSATQAKKHRPNRFVRWVNRIDDSKPAQKVGLVWNTLNNYSYIFWLVVMPFIVIFGVAAAFSMVFMPIIAGIALAVGAVFTIWKLVNHYADINWKFKLFGKQFQITSHRHKLNNQTKSRKDNGLKPVTKEEKQHQAAMRHEAGRMLHEMKLRMVMKTKQRVQLEQLKQQLDVQDAVTFTKKEILDSLFDDDAEDASETESETETLLANKKAKFDLRAHLLGSDHERRGRLAITAIRGALGGLSATIFVLWLLSTVVGALIVPALAAMGATGAAAGLGAAGTFVGGSLFSTIAGGVVGTVFGVRRTTQLHATQLRYKQKVDALLNAPYKVNKAGLLVDSKLTKQQVFEKLLADVEMRKAAILQNKAFVASAKQDGCDLKKVLKGMDVFNDAHFETLKPKKSGFERFKSFMSRAYTAFAGSQGGMFHARYLLLAGGVAAGGIVTLAALTGGTALIGFLVAIAVMAVVYGTLAGMEYHLQRKQHHRERFADTIDARISYLVKQDKQLRVIEQSMTTKKPVNDESAADVKTSKATAEPKAEKKQSVKTKLASCLNFAKIGKPKSSMRLFAAPGSASTLEPVGSLSAPSLPKSVSAKA